MRARLLYADSERSADMLYVTGLFVPDPFLFLEDPDGCRHVVVSALEVDRVRRKARTSKLKVHNLQEVQKRCRNASSRSNWIVCFLKQHHIHSAYVPSDFPVGLADTLRKNGFKLSPVSDDFWPTRSIKQPVEVQAIESALRIAEQGMAAAIKTLRAAQIDPDNRLLLDGAPLTSERVRQVIDGTLIQAGGLPHHTIVSGGRQAANPHEAGRGPLFAHQPIVLDIFPRSTESGYWGDMTRTVCRGEAPERVRQAWEAVHAAQKIAFTHIRHGASGRKIHKNVKKQLKQLGFPTKTLKDGRQSGFFHGTGHGLGLALHESPRISEKEERLKKGHVVTVEPGVYHPDMGGVRIEDVVLVEKAGCRCLTHFPKMLEI